MANYAREGVGHLETIPLTGQTLLSYSLYLVLALILNKTFALISFVIIGLKILTPFPLFVGL